MDENKTARKVKYCIVIVLALIAGYYVAAIMEYAYQNGSLNIASLNMGIEVVTSAPFRFYWNIYTKKMMMYALLAAVLWVLYDSSLPNKYRIGKEYGEAEWGDPKEISRRLADRDKSNNLVLSKHLRMSLDTHKTKRNKNTVAVGGSGAGKSLFYVTPNLFLANGSYIVTDPKGELQARHGEHLKKEGYIVKSLNVIDPDESDRYNPFRYARDEEDITKMVNAYIENTTDKTAAKEEGFWLNQAKELMEALCLYIWLELPYKEKTLPTVADLLGKERISDDGKPSDLCKIMRSLPPNHIARVKYEKIMIGAADTVRSIYSTLNSRMGKLHSPKIRRLLSDDDMDIASVGVGLNGDGKTKTAIFLKIPDNDKTYNFIVGMFYTQAIQELYYQADQIYGGRVPIPVSLWMDEFANIALPDNFLTAEATMRSREISVNVIVQNLAQLKALFKESWETVIGNADSFVYLGGNDPETFKYVSERLGNETIDKKSNSVNKGGSGSYSEQYDRMSHALKDAAGVGRLLHNKCIVFIRGENPVIDEKYGTLADKVFLAFSRKRYVHPVNIKRDRRGRIIADNTVVRPSMEMLSQESLEYFRTAEAKGDNVVVYDCDISEILDFTPGQLTMAVREKYYAVEESMELVYKPAVPQQGKTDAEGQHNLLQAIIRNDLNAAQKEQVMLGYQHGLTEKEIMMYCYASWSAERMRRSREIIEAARRAAGGNG